MAYPESDEKLMFLQKQPSYYHIRLYIGFKPICYGMIVAVLYYHSSIITIMV